MPVSQNGYSANDESLMRRAFVPGTTVEVKVRRGAPGDLLLHLAERWNREVEPLFAPDGELDCWRRYRNEGVAGLVRQDGISLHRWWRQQQLHRQPARSRRCAVNFRPQLSHR